jgi:hypothetical protein
MSDTMESSMGQKHPKPAWTLNFERHTYPQNLIGIHPLKLKLHTVLKADQVHSLAPRPDVGWCLGRKFGRKERVG